VSGRISRWAQLAAALCIVLAVALVPSAATAQSADPSTPNDDSGLSISPAIVDNTVDAGTTFTVPITLGNITQRAVPIEVTKGKLETEQTPGPSKQGLYDISSWLSVDPTAFLLPAQDHKVVNVTVSVPANAEPGGHYATVFFGALAPSGGMAAGETLLNARVGVVFLITVRGDVHAGAKLDGAIKTEAWQLGAGATSFNFDLENTGNVHFQPSGKLIVKDLFGRKVKELPLPIGVVLPGAKKSYALTWERGVRPGIYTASVKVDTGIELQAESKRFVILPLVVVIPVGIFLLVVLITIWRLRRKKKRRARREAAIEAITGSGSEENTSEPITDESEPVQQKSTEVDAESSNLPPDPKEEQQ
jgi:hypothetical protein